MVLMSRELDMMGCSTELGISRNDICSGRGECTPNGTCLCEIRYTGSECVDFNNTYHASEFTIQ